MKLSEEEDSESFKWASSPLNLKNTTLPTRPGKQQPSDPWKDVDADEVGLYVWRVTRYAAVPWPVEERGHFYERDTYIVLNISQAGIMNEILRYDVHIWLGRLAISEDHMTAIAKAHELDTFLENQAVLHREVQTHESTLFIGYFSPITVWLGSSDHNYRWAKLGQKNYPARLLMMYKPDASLSTLRVKEVPTSGIELDNTRIYILDLGSHLIQWIGSLCGTEDVLKGVQYTEYLNSDRGSKVKVEVIHEKQEEDENATLSRHPFYVYVTQNSYLNSMSRSRPQQNGGPATNSKQSPAQRGDAKENKPKLLKVAIVKGQVSYKKVKESNISIKDFEKNVFCIYDNFRHCFVWMANKMGLNERQNAFEYVHTYLLNSTHPLVPVTVLRQSQKSPSLQRALVVL